MAPYWDLALIAASAALLLKWLSGRIRTDLAEQIRTLNGIRAFLAILPLSLYTVVAFLHLLSLLLAEPLRTSAGTLTLAISVLGICLLFLICALFVGLSLLHALWSRIEPALRSRQLRLGTQAELRMQLSLGQSRAGLLANLILLMMMPIPILLLRFRRQLFAYFPGEVGWQNGAPFYLLTLCMLATALYGLRRHYDLWQKEQDLFRRLG